MATASSCGFNRLGDVDLEAGEHGPHAVFAAGEGGEGDGRGPAAFVVGQAADVAHELVAVGDRHADVAHQHVRPEGADVLQAFQGRTGGGARRRRIA